MKEDIDLYITRERLNKTRFRRKLNPIVKNIIRRQNPLELLYFSTFDVQNPIIRFLVRKILVGKKDLASKLISKAPNPLDIELQYSLQAPKNDVDDFKNNNDSFGGFPSPQPPPNPPPSPA